MFFSCPWPEHELMLWARSDPWIPLQDLVGSNNSAFGHTENDLKVETAKETGFSLESKETT